MRFDNKINSCWWALRIGLGLAAVLAGLDKYFNLLANWSMYVSPLAGRVVPIGAETLMHLIGPIEMLVGLAILTRWTRIGAYVLAVWLVGIAINLVTTGMFFDLAVRDVEMAIAAYVLASLTEVRASAEVIEQHSANVPPRTVVAA